MKPSTLLTLTATAASTSAFTLPFKFSRDTAVSTDDSSTPNRRLVHSSPTYAGNARVKAALAGSKPQSLRAGAYLPYHPPAATPEHPNANQDMIQSVTGTVIIPTIDMPESGPTAGNIVGEYSASIWVGIDGASATDNFINPNSTGKPTCNPLSQSLRAGVDLFWDGTLGGQQTPYVWTQWFPTEHAQGFLGFKASPGDELKFTISTGPHGNSAGGVLVENFGPPQSPKGPDGIRLPIATGSLIWKDMPGLCGAQASWIVEDFPLQERPELPSALGNFTDVRFSEMGMATWLGGNFTKDEITGEGKGLKMLEIYDQGQGGTLTKCKTEGEGEKAAVVCSRVVEA